MLVSQIFYLHLLKWVGVLVLGWKGERGVKVFEGMLIWVVVEFDFGQISRVLGRWVKVKRD